MIKPNLEKLKKLSASKQLVFAYLICERLLPNYTYFSINYGFGKPKLLRDTIAFIHENLFNDLPESYEINRFAKLIEDNTPDTENFDTNYVSSALDACTAILETLHFMVDKTFNRIEDVANFAIDSVDMYIQEIDALDFNNDKLFEQKINSHPLMQKEISLQQGAIAYLTSRTDLDYNDVQTLLNLQENNGKGSLNL